MNTPNTATSASIADQLAQREAELAREAHDAEILSNAINGKGGYIELLIAEKKRAEQAEQQLKAANAKIASLEQEAEDLGYALREESERSTEE